MWLLSDDVDSKTSYGCEPCRRVGWPTPNRYGYGHGRIWLDDLGCLGGETFIGDCHHGGWGRHNCGHYEDVAVACYNASENGTFSQRVVITCLANIDQFDWFFYCHSKKITTPWVKKGCHCHPNHGYNFVNSQSIFFIFVLCITVCCMNAWVCNTVRWTWWDWSLSLGPLLPSVLWHCWLGHLTRKNRPRNDL